MKLCKEQSVYSQTKRAYELAGARQAAYEREFLAAHAALDRNGHPALRLWQVVDDAIFETLDALYAADPVAADFGARFSSARRAYVVAEKTLISFALAIVPAGVRSTLAHGAEHDSGVRKKIIDLAMSLDTATITAR